MIAIDQLSFSYPGQDVLKNFSLKVATGEIHALIGPSGCGKSTLLQLIAGLKTPMSGHIVMDERTLSHKSHFVPPENRKIGLVFQEHCLFPHMSVMENVCFGITKGKNQKEKAQQFLEMAELSDKSTRFPYELSGGEQQRVAIARTLASEPDALLMDEPFSSLDRELRERLRTLTQSILKELGLTTIVVTHSIDEAIQFADRHTLLHKNGVYETGSFEDLRTQPQCFETARFLNTGIFLKGEFSEGQLHVGAHKFPAQPSEAAGSPHVLGFVPFSQVSLSEKEGIECKVLRVDQLPQNCSVKMSSPLFEGEIQLKTPHFPSSQKTCRVKINTPTPLILFPA